MRISRMMSTSVVACLLLTGCNGSMKDENAALRGENQQLRAQVSDVQSDRDQAITRANQAAAEAKTARDAERRATEQASRRITTNTPTTTSGLRATRTPVAPPPAPKPQYHTVKSGETLSHIALKYYRDANAWQSIYTANKSAIGPSADRLQVGMKLTIPPAS